jgi:Zn-dependent protease with chaperone function
MLSSLWALLVIVGLRLIATGHDQHHRSSDRHPVTTVLVIVAFVLLMVGPMVVVLRAIRRSMERIRGADLKRRGSGRQIGVGLVIGVAGAVVFSVVASALPRHGVAAAFSRAGAFAVIVLLLQLGLAPLLMISMRARVLPAECEQRFQQLADRMGVRVRGFRIIPGRRQRIANAVQVGAFPRLRYVAVTDYLLDSLAPDEQDAIVAHELSHAAHRDVLKKASAWLATWLVLQFVLIGIGGTGSHSSSSPLVALSPLVVIVALIAVQGLLGVRLERRADADGARVVGEETMAQALARIGELNHSKGNTGRTWNLLTQHPGLDQRIAAARQAAQGGGELASHDVYPADSAVESFRRDRTNRSTGALSKSNNNAQ